MILTAVITLRLTMAGRRMQLVMCRFSTRPRRAGFKEEEPKGSDARFTIIVDKKQI